MSQSATAADNLLGNRDKTHGWAQQIEHVLRVPPILTVWARHQTGWSVTKCHACHEKRHDNLRGNICKRRGFAAFPIDTELATRRRPNWTRRRRDDDPTRHSRRTRVQPPDYKREPFTTHSGKTRMMLAQSCWSEGTISAKKKGGFAILRYLIKDQNVAPVWPDSVSIQEKSRLPFLRLLSFRLTGWAKCKIFTNLANANSSAKSNSSLWHSFVLNMCESQLQLCSERGCRTAN